MKKEVTVKAKSVEEALTLAAAELGAPESEINYTVIAEAKRGFLGLGSADAEISAYYIPRGEQAAIDFINTVIADMQLTAQIETRDGKDGELIIDVSGEGSGILIGHHGETLDSLQYLASLAANKKVDGKKDDYVRITVDVEGYRAKREETLRALARRMAARVQKYKKSVMLEPMNPYERRIIHSEIQNIAGVSTNSIGSENNRKIVIFLDGDAE